MRELESLNAAVLRAKAFCERNRLLKQSVSKTLEGIAALGAKTLSGWCERARWQR
jgi:hypothetical protein